MKLPDLTARQWYTLVAVISAALMAYGLVLQFFGGLEPCPLCILQRYAFVAVALLAGVAATIESPRLGRLFAALALLSTVAGAGMATWHIKLQLFPPEVGSCGPGLAYMLMELPLARALPRIFQGGGDCTAVDWSFLGLSIPAWALVWFVLLAAALVMGIRKTSR